MSTYYYLACDQCQKQVPFWCRSAGGPSVIPTADKYPETVQEFIDDHLEHGISAMSEHDDRHERYAEPNYPE